MVARVESLQEFVGKLACGSGEHLFVDCCGNHSGGHCCVHNAVCDPVDLAGETEDCCALCCLTVCVCVSVCVRVCQCFVLLLSQAVCKVQLRIGVETF